MIRNILFAVLFLAMFSSHAIDLSEVMPRNRDRTSMWWRDGYPTVVDGAPWRRFIETGNYWMLLDTDTLQIPRIGPKTTPIGQLKGAELELKMIVDGKEYLCRKSAEVTRFTGPRLIESGRFLQRADVTNLIFTGEDGAELNVDARFETVAWADQLGLILAARPGQQSIKAGETSFGRVRGGFGLDGTNRFDIAAVDCQTPEKFTLEFWFFIPSDYRAGKHNPWLICKNPNEAAEGHYGIIIRREGLPEAIINVGGGSINTHRINADRRNALQLNGWNHLAISYDGDIFSLYTNGQTAGEIKVGKQRIPKPGGLAFGDRQDCLGKGDFRARGIVDEIRLYDRALSVGELRRHFRKPEVLHPGLKPIKEWKFNNNILMSLVRLREKWESAAIEMRLASARGELTSRRELQKHSTDWQETSLMLDPVSFSALPTKSDVTVVASEIVTGDMRPVSFEPSLGCHRVNLDGIKPVPPAGMTNPTNDAIERVKLTLINPTKTEQVTRLMFEKSRGGIQQKIGTPITGVSAILRDRDGNPTGIPVQLSKNWHIHLEDESAYTGQWFHGISQVRLPPGKKIELELTIIYGHWGGIPAASHSQLSLIGWGGNQRWEQSALGSWGESICYEPEQVQANSSITDVRPLMVNSKVEKPQWGWTANVGGGDFFRMFDTAGKRVPHAGMKADYHKQGPCLTEVTYTGRVGKSYAINHHETVSLARSDDLVCGTYRIRMNVTEPVDFSRFVIFQIGSDTYSSTANKMMAVGDENGATKEWPTQWGGNTYRGKPMECSSRIPWVSLHEAVGMGNQDFAALANRGIVIRKWKAKLGGKESKPWIAERGTNQGSKHFSTLDIVPPPGTHRLEPGDYVEATIEHIVVPQFSKDYYGPNIGLRNALAKHENTAHMIYRQAVGDDLDVTVTKGRLEHLYPDVRMVCEINRAEFSMKGGIGYVPITFKNLTSYKGFNLTIDGVNVDQSVHGNDFWQTDYDPRSKTWSQTYNIPGTKGKTIAIKFGPAG